MRRERTAQKASREEMKQFCGLRQQEKDTDDNIDADDTEDGGDSGEDTDDSTEDDDKKQEAKKQYKLVALLGQAAAQYLKGDKKK